MGEIKINSEELGKEIDESETYFRVIVSGGFKDFKEIKNAIDYLGKAFEIGATYGSLRKIYFFKNEKKTDIPTA